MQQIYKFSLEEAKDIIRKAKNLPDDAYIEIEWLPTYPVYPDWGRIINVPNTTPTSPYPTVPIIYCWDTTPTTNC